MGWCTAALRLGALALGLVLAGCATGPQANPADPLESWNRGAYKFNDALDSNVLKPVATTYENVVPGMVRKGISNFFANLGDAWTTVNGALQLKGQVAGESFTRFWVNTFFGLGGVLDVASEMQIPRHNEDFGQTLGYWGVGAGPYVVIPFLGPSTVRDTVALPVDWKGDLLQQEDNIRLRNSATVVRFVDKRASLLKQEKLMEGATLDKYVLMRDVYLQYRLNQVYDGNPPEEKQPEDDGYEPEPESAPGSQPAAVAPAEPAK